MIAQANSVHIPLADKSVQCVVTSPPYWGLRDYGLEPTMWPTVEYTPMAGMQPVMVPGCDAGCRHEWGNQLLRREQSGRHRMKWITGGNPSMKVGDGPVSQGQWCQHCGGWRGCLGLEPTVEMYVAHIVAVFREVWRVLRDDGTLWLNLGDSYVGGGRGYSSSGRSYNGEKQSTNVGSLGLSPTLVSAGLKSKDLAGIPWRVAFALQADGWYLRSDIIWEKVNCMPESVKDRPTKSHEYLFLLTKSLRYYYDADAIKENKAGSTRADTRSNDSGHRQSRGYVGAPSNGGTNLGGPRGKRNKRTVWSISTSPYHGAHFAVFPPALVIPCVLAGTCLSSIHSSIILDPFCGSGTVGQVCRETRRKFIGLDLSLPYLRDLALLRAENKCAQDKVYELPLLSQKD